MSLNVSLHSTPIEVTPEGICQIEGVKYAAVGFGTFPFKDETCFTAAACAAESGYRIIDTATWYGNFDPISRLLHKYGRNHFYVISKVWPNSHTRPLLQEDLKITLEKLQTDYLDAYFLHWPNSKVPIEETLSTLEEFRQSKLIRHIGLSNITVNHLKRALELKIPITWVQVEMNPFYYDPELLAFCQKNGITVQAWGPLGRGRINSDATLAHLGKKYGKSPSQIALKWIIQHGCIPLPGSKTPKHIQENINLMDFVLSEEEMKEINKSASLGERERVTLEAGVGFTDEFDFSYEECWPKALKGNEMKDFYSIEIFDPSLNSWEKVKDEIMELESAIFGDEAFDEEIMRGAFQDPDNIIIIMRDKNRRAIGYTWATPAKKTYEEEAEYDVFAGRIASDDTSYIYNTGLRPEYQGKKLIIDLYKAQDEELLKRGYKRIQTDAKLEGGFAANILNNNRDKLINHFEHDSLYGRQMFIDMWIVLPNLG